jgi:malonate transporter and related proteins
MLPVVVALVPVFLVIATGYVMRVTGIVAEEQWRGFERLTYFVFFPAIIIETLVKAELSTVPVLGVGAALIGAILSNAVIVLALRRPLEQTAALDGPSFTSLFQGSTRWNTFVALALAGALYGNDGITLMAIAIAAMIPLLNVMAVLALARFAGGASQSPRDIVLTLARNPFIWSCAVGIAVNAAALPIPRIALDYAGILGRASLAAGLLVVGSGLDLTQLARPRAAHWLSCALKLLLLPLLVAIYMRGLGVTGVGRTVALVAASVPTSSAAFILARQLGGNAPLMAEIITLQTLVAIVTMPVVLALLG